MSVFEERALQWAIDRNLRPSQVRAATIEQIAQAAQATLGEAGFFPQSVRRFVSARLRQRAQETERERLRALLESRIQQEYPQARAVWRDTPEHGRVLAIYAVPIEDISGED